MLNKIYLQKKRELKFRFFKKHSNKYFCIGFNKTGTTSMKKAFEDLGFLVGDQRKATLIADKSYFIDDYNPIIRFSATAQVFQDAPFSWPLTYKYLDKAYPNSKFILTVRDSSEQWYKSLVSYHSKIYGEGNNIAPTISQLNSGAKKLHRPVNVTRVHGTDDSDPYNEKIMRDNYEKHNADVLEYFKDRPEDLLVINLSDKEAYKKFVDFIGVESPYDKFPWENKT